MYVLKGRKEFPINRFGKRMTSDEDGIYKTDVEAERDIFIAYGFELQPAFDEPINIEIYKAGYKPQISNDEFKESKDLYNFSIKRKTWKSSKKK